ncbi:endopeptidase La [Natribacillus halophilus]|uniref:Lon protease n=1 Tax=Natribacillus halophilus TaxID=549003 RepID=A0A1G8LSP6_9BACI|nr:endopeptidase La [Natribacillus halophilus]SDI58653.1 ATP-dependent proteinase. Serine peptidase. MEROPS family S16 [Natribacillus halophilus]
MPTTETSRKIPLLPLRGALVFPGMVLHLDVGRDKSVQAIERVMEDDQYILLASQIDLEVEAPTINDLYRTGTLAYIKQMLKMPNGTTRILVEGLQRAVINDITASDRYYEVLIEPLSAEQSHQAEVTALKRTVLDHFEHYAKASSKISEETTQSIRAIDEPGHFADTIASHLPLKVERKQDILEAISIEGRLQKLLDILSNEKEVLDLEQKIGERVKKSMERTQKEYYLREQMKAIQNELGDQEGKGSEVETLRAQIEEANMPENVAEKAHKELARYERVPTASAESSVIRTYLDWLVALPWHEETIDQLDLENAERVLNEDHYGLEKVKERVLEHLAVQQLTQSLSGQILCLTGPPGVGKTSLAKSVARSLGREFVRISLGGVRDEAEIRGHRRTYVGALPGKIIQGINKAGVRNPVFLLDEVDKMAMDFRGDPSSALLEVLDPEQNSQFGDHYIEETYDLSDVMFITTANNVSAIPAPLLDRMEAITIAGYTEIEKKAIASNYLLPKQLERHGLSKTNLQIKEDALVKVIRYYTREAGVRNLERELAAICRKAAKTIVTGEKKKVIVTLKTLEDMLGKPRMRYGQVEEKDQIGTATGLAYTTAGGDTLSIEVSIYGGKGELTLTGHLGDVMKESARAAFSYIRSSADTLGIDERFHENTDIHIHVPEGATPKDGPSAGITIAIALISALTGRVVKKEVGMTGEITLRGRVLLIGGVKEKSMSAHRAGLTTILLPKENAKDLEDIPESIRNDISIHLVSHLDEVIQYALGGRRDESE